MRRPNRHRIRRSVQLNLGVRDEISAGRRASIPPKPSQCQQVAKLRPCIRTRKHVDYRYGTVAGGTTQRIRKGHQMLRPPCQGTKIRNRSNTGATREIFCPRWAERSRMCRHSRSNAQTTNVSWEVGKGECQGDHHCISHCGFEKTEAFHDAAEPV